MVYRVARRSANPFAPPPWELAGEDGTFGNRFDDPSAGDGRPLSARFRTIYCATTAAGAFGETVARFRPSLALLAQLQAVDDAEPFESAFAEFLDPADPTKGVIPADWRLGHRLAPTLLNPLLRFVDLPAPSTLQHLRAALAPTASGLGLPDFDLSAVTSPQRRLTQACARYVYERVDEAGSPAFAGLRYLSRLHNAWECWAIFSDRLRHDPGFPETIFPDNPHLQEVASLYHLAVEGLAGHLVRA